MQLDCGSCWIRSWHPGDVESLVRNINDRAVWVNVRDGLPHPYTHADAEHWVRLAPSQGPETDFAIVVDGQAVGGIGLKLHGDVERYFAEIGYWLGQEFWGRGLATAALRTFTRSAFRAHELTRIYAVPFAENVASVRVLEKAGYHFEGRLRRSAIKEGVVRDQVLYAITDEDIDSNS